MNKTSIFYFSLAAIAIGSLASCQDYDPLNEDELQAATYKNEFIKAFGSIDPNHDWGFGESLQSKQTRAVNVNSNEWESIYNYVVPGGIAKSAEEYDNNGGSWTSSDVTVDERRYVYWWFSTHRNPTKLDVNWNSYFLQNVWGQPEHSRKYVEYAQYTKDNVAQDYSGIYFGMDFIWGGTGEHCEHINDFNAGGATKEQIMYVYNTDTKDFSYNSSYATNETRYHRYTLQYINGKYYLAFDCEAHKCGNPSTCTHDIDCYKLGYDEQANKVEGGQKCKHGAGDPCLIADGFYNDWILKLGAGIRKKGADYTKRVMCEDLGGTFDFDFDDIVFDVSPAPDNGLEITLQAAGGTLPVYLCQIDEDHEVHKMLGLNKLEPINVELNGHSRPVSVLYLTSDQADALGIGFTVVSVPYTEHNNNGTLGGSNSKNVRIYHAQDVPIYVKVTSNSAVDIDSETEEIKRLSVYTGEAPDKFGCKNSTKWMIERKHIKDGYTSFENWVKAATTEWESTIGDEDLLYPFSGSGTTQNGVYRPNEFIDGTPSHSEAVVAWSTLCQEIDWNNWLNKAQGNKTDLSQELGVFFEDQRPQHLPSAQ